MVWQSLNVKEDLQYKFVSSSVSLNVLMEKMMTGAQMLIGDATNSECSWFLNICIQADFSICIEATGTRNLDFQCVASFDRFERRYRKINLTEYILDAKPSGGRYHISMAQNTFVQHIQLATEQNTSQITLMSILSRLLFLDIPSSNPAQNFHQKVFISDNLLFSNITMALPSDKLISIFWWKYSDLR